MMVYGRPRPSTPSSFYCIVCQTVEVNLHELNPESYSLNCFVGVVVV